MRRLVFGNWVLTLVLGVVACSGEPTPIQPKARVSTSPTAAPRPATTLTPPPMPKQAERNDATGAANFVLYWVQVSNYAALTGDTDLLRSISDPACEGCNRYIDLYERTYAAGGYFKGGDREVRDISATTANSDFYVSAILAASSGSFKLSQAAKAQATGVEATTVTFRLNTTRPWKLRDVGLSP